MVVVAAEVAGEVAMARVVVACGGVDSGNNGGNDEGNGGVDDGSGGM